MYFNNKERMKVIQELYLVYRLCTYSVAHVKKHFLYCWQQKVYMYV